MKIHRTIQVMKEGKDWVIKRSGLKKIICSSKDRYTALRYAGNISRKRNVEIQIFEEGELFSTISRRREK